MTQSPAALSVAHGLSPVHDGRGSGRSLVVKGRARPEAYRAGGRSAQTAIKVISSSSGESLLIRKIMAPGLDLLGAAVVFSVVASLFA